MIEKSKVARFKEATLNVLKLIELKIYSVFVSEFFC